MGNCHRIIFKGLWNAHLCFLSSLQCWRDTASRNPPEPSLLPHWPPRPPGAPPHSRFRQKLAKAAGSESWGEGGEQRRKELVMGGVRGSRNSVEKVGDLGKKTP